VRAAVASLLFALAVSACDPFGTSEVFAEDAGATAPGTADGGGGASPADAGVPRDAGDGGGLSGALQLPANASTTEASSANTSPFGGAGQRFQSVYGVPLLTALPNGATITGMRLRLDGDAMSFKRENLMNFEVRLSTSKKPPGSLSQTFADNRGSDEVIVRAGPLTIEPSDYPSGAKPNAFGKTIDFNLGTFTYRGGPLLLEVGATAVQSGRNVDNVSPSTQESQTVYGSGFSATRADGPPFFDLIVVEYTFTYPPTK
jgi:hypothetical protein